MPALIWKAERTSRRRHEPRTDGGPVLRHENLAAMAKVWLLPGPAQNKEWSSRPCLAAMVDLNNQSGP